MDVTQPQELPRVLAEIASAMGGCGVALTLHPEDRRRPSLLHIEASVATPPLLVDELLRNGTMSLGLIEDFAWIECSAGAMQWDAIVLPIQRVAGHSPLAIIVFFSDLAAGQRAEAEAVYRRRRPFAIGYFRLWQVDRIRQRRIGALEAALDLTAVGIMLLDRSGHLMFANQAARALLLAADGLRERDGRLRAATLSDGARLQAALSHALATDEEIGASVCTPLLAPMLAVARPNRADLILSVLPATLAPIEPGDVAATVFIVDPESDTERLLEPVCKLFKLSHVETRLTCRLAAGATLHEAATALRLKDQTARGYLKHIFIKTGTNRQSELVRTLLSRAVRLFERTGYEIV